MANSYFDFKQFRIDQGNCGMKVSTDACIHGAWTPIPTGPCRILDVGAGTGLLSLMLAQRAPLAMIDALEIDEAAALQARENVVKSKFADRIHVIHDDARQWAPEAQYDLIICNPPFFKNSLAGSEASRNLARHNLALQQEDLIRLLNTHLKTGGIASLLWPSTEGAAFTALAANANWILHDQLSIRDKSQTAIKRVVSIYSRTSVSEVHPSLVIKQEDGTYTADFKALLAPFYLHL